MMIYTRQLKVPVPTNMSQKASQLTERGGGDCVQQPAI